jgi:hypothetical protein
VWATFAPLIVLYVTAMAFIINNEIFREREFHAEAIQDCAR